MSAAPMPRKNALDTRNPSTFRGGKERGVHWPRCFCFLLLSDCTQLSLVTIHDLLAFLRRHKRRSWPGLLAGASSAPAAAARSASWPRPAHMGALLRLRCLSLAWDDQIVDVCKVPRKGARVKENERCASAAALPSYLMDTLPWSSITTRLLHQRTWHIRSSPSRLAAPSTTASVS